MRKRCVSRVLAKCDFYEALPVLSGPRKNWSYWEYEGLVADGGVFLAGRGRGNLNTERYTVTAEQDMVYWKDHFKYYIYADQSVAIPERGKTEFEFVARVTTNGRGCNSFPFPPDVVRSTNDVRLASGGFSAFDPITGMNFAFHLTNDMVYAVYERNVTATRSQCMGGQFAAVNGFSYFIPVKTRKPTMVHSMKIVVDSDRKSVSWVLDKKEVLDVCQVGFRLKKQRCYMVNDLGGHDFVTFPRRLRYGFGSFTFLDYYPACQPDGTANSTCNFPCKREGLVRTAINYALPQYNPILGEPNLAHFYDNLSNRRSRLWGQGSETMLHRIKVSQQQCHQIRC